MWHKGAEGGQREREPGGKMWGSLGWGSHHRGRGGAGQNKKDDARQERERETEREKQ